MINKVFCVLCALFFSQPSYVSQDDEVILDDMQTLTSKIRASENISVVIPSLEFSTNEIFDFLYMLKNQSYDEDAYGDLEGGSKDYLEEKLKISQKLVALNQRIEK